MVIVNKHLMVKVEIQSFKDSGKWNLTHEYSSVNEGHDTTSLIEEAEEMHPYLKKLNYTLKARYPSGNFMAMNFRLVINKS